MIVNSDNCTGDSSYLVYVPEPLCALSLFSEFSIDFLIFLLPPLLPPIDFPLIKKLSNPEDIHNIFLITD